MNEKNKKVSEDQIIEDSLDITIHEVARKSDLELAHQFLMHNNDALHNPNAIFTNIDTGEEDEVEVQGLSGIDASLRLQTLKEVQKKKIVLRQLLAEDYQKKFWKQKWKNLVSFFKPEIRAYKQKFDYHLETNDWKNYERDKIRRNREKEIKHNDFLTYTDLQLRDNKKLKRILFFESFITLFILTLSILFMALITNAQQAFIISTTSSIGTLLSQIKSGIYAFSILAILAFIVPYFFLFTSWFVGINDVHKSRNFHYFTAIFLIIATALILIATGLIITYYAYSFSLWIPS